MKELPKHLKYAFLGAEKAKPVIILVDLIEEKEQILIEILIKYKEEIAWSVEDLKGISPSISMHKILIGKCKNINRTSEKTESSYERFC